MKALITAVATAALLAACGTTGTSRTSAATPSTPTDAVTWNDFERWFFAQRGVSQNTLVTTR